VRRAAAALAALSVLVAAVGCAKKPAAPLPRMSGVRTVEVPAMEGSVAPSGHGLTVHDHLTSRLTGPNFSTGLLWSATGPELAGTDASWLHLRPVRAAAGERLTIAAIDPSDTYAAFGSAPVTVQVTVGGRATAVPGLPLPYQDSAVPSQPSSERVIMVSAAADVPVHLRATDAGRTAELDLRTGATVSAPFTLRQGTGDVPWQGSWPVARYLDNGVPLAGTFRVDAPNQQVASLVSYAPGAGWAPAGSAFLLVPLPDVDCDLGPCISLTVTLDDPAAFTFKAKDGTAGVTLAGHHSVDVSYPTAVTGGTADPVSFRVPATVTTGTISLDWATGAVTEEDDAGHQIPASWLRAPGTATATISLKP
jgi:hypothetical protein